MAFMKVEMLDIEKVVPYKNNPRIISEEAVKKVQESLQNFGWQQPIVIDKNNVVIVGHTRLKAAKGLGYKKVVVHKTSLDPEKVNAYRIADNKVGELSSWDDALLQSELLGLQEIGADMSMSGLDTLDIDTMLNGNSYDSDPAKAKNMFKKFLVPPFSILDARKGYWQKRKKFWIEEVGINSGEGRDDNLVFKNVKVALKGTRDTSIFDPVLCEVLLKWFSKEGDTILDPFAGGSVRGIVSSLCDREYTGIDLSQRQIEANKEQADRIIKNTKYPNWVIGDSINIDKLVKNKYNMILSCPPYHDLEKYTDDPEDLSNKSWEEFNSIYQEIIHKTCALLKDDSFVCWVVGEIRDKRGYYKSFVPRTIDYFEEAGLHYYNDIILATSIGSLPLRASYTFQAGRKVGKSHQNVLIFFKGNIKLAMERLGEVYIPDEDELNAES